MQKEMTWAQKRREARKHGQLENVKVGDWVRIENSSHAIRSFLKVDRVTDSLVKVGSDSYYKNGVEVGTHRFRCTAFPATVEEAEAWRRAESERLEQWARERDERERIENERRSDPYWCAAWSLSTLGDEKIVEVLRSTITVEQALKITNR